MADDLAQETFIKAYTNLASFRNLAGFSTWLFRIICVAAAVVVFFVFNGWREVWRLFSEILHAPVWHSLEQADPKVYIVTFLLTGSFVLYETPNIPNLHLFVSIRKYSFKLALEEMSLFNSCYKVSIITFLC